VPTYECFNKCTYCNFRTALSGDTSGWADLEQVDRKLQQLAEQGQVSEVLVLAGEIHPARYAPPAYCMIACLCGCVVVWLCGCVALRRVSLVLSCP
jgi:2-iminoacetate synthase ThiH